MQRSAKKRREGNYSSTPSKSHQMAAAGVLAQGFLFTIFALGLNGVCSSGTLVGFSYDARGQITAALSEHKAQFKILAANPGGDHLGPLSSTNISVNLFVRDSELKKVFQSKASATSWLKGHLFSGFGIDSSIIVSSNGQALPSLLSTLLSVRASQKTFAGTKISVMFSLSRLETLHRTDRENLCSLVQTLKNWESPVMVEALVGRGELRLSSDFIRSTIEMDFSACSYLPYPDVPITLILKILVSSREELAEFSHKVLKFLRSEALLRRSIAKLFIDISHLEQGESMFSSLRSELLSHGRELIAATKTTMHDIFNPVTNPATTPITVPSTNPAPAVVTVPSTNPVTVVPTNPTMSPITIPPMNPVGTPITVPGADPFPTPLTPAVPVTNPATTPITYPTNPPPTNPVTTYPFTPPGGTPAMIPPVTVPSTVPVTPAVPGQTWCVAKAGTTDAALQLALDYACGFGGADCSAIQPTGSCYSPDSLQSHASYAFNSYYQKNPVATSCDFGGTAMLVNVNPSTGTCIYPSSASSMSSSIPAYNPASTAGGSSTPGSGSSVVNTNSPASSNTVFGSVSSPASSLSGALALPISSTCLVFVLTISFFVSCNM